MKIPKRLQGIRKARVRVPRDASEAAILNSIPPGYVIVPLGRRDAIDRNGLLYSIEYIIVPLAHTGSD